MDSILGTNKQMEKNIHQHHFQITRNDREKLYRHKAILIWFTGLSGSGKSTLANELEKQLHHQQIATYTLDGDNIRSGINNDLSFSDSDRTENIRRIAEVSKLFVDAGIVTLASFVSPFQKDRQLVRQTVGAEFFFEIYLKTSLKECQRRDVKGLYEKALKGEIANMTGLNSPYEVPTNADIVIDTEKLSINDSASIIYNQIIKKIHD